MFTAGGLGPDNVAQCVLDVAPMAVDASSGMEKVKGVKDPELVAFSLFLSLFLPLSLPPSLPPSYLPPSNVCGGGGALCLSLPLSAYLSLSVSL